MQFITVRELRGKSAEIWRCLSREGEIVITSNGKPMAILSAVDEATLEESLVALRRARAAAAIAAVQRVSVQRGLHKLSRKDIDTEIAAVRRNRPR